MHSRQASSGSIRLVLMATILLSQHQMDQLNYIRFLNDQLQLCQTMKYIYLDLVGSPIVVSLLQVIYVEILSCGIHKVVVRSIDSLLLLLQILDLLQIIQLAFHGIPQVIRWQYLSVKGPTLVRNVYSGELVVELVSSETFDVAWSPDGKYIVTPGNNIEVWSASTYTTVTIVEFARFHSSVSWETR